LQDQPGSFLSIFKRKVEQKLLVDIKSLDVVCKVAQQSDEVDDEDQIE
jgi:hypothetical protein